MDIKVRQVLAAYSSGWRPFFVPPSILLFGRWESPWTTESGSGQGCPLRAQSSGLGGDWGLAPVLNSFSGLLCERKISLYLVKAFVVVGFLLPSFVPYPDELPSLVSDGVGNLNLSQWDLKPTLAHHNLMLLGPCVCSTVPPLSLRWNCKGVGIGGGELVWCDSLYSFIPKTAHGHLTGTEATWDQTQDPERVVEMTAPLRSRKLQLSATRLATQPPLVAGESCTQVALGPSISTDRLWSTGSPLKKLG